MDGLITILREFPAIWAFIGGLGTILGVSLWYFTFGKKIAPLYSKTITDMAKVHEIQIAASERALKMQKEHYEEEVNYIKESIAKLESERNDYREKLHEEKKLHQGAMFQVAELQARPNVDKVYEGQQQFFSQMSKYMNEQTETMKAIHVSILEHDRSIDKRQAEAIEEIVARVNKK